MKKIFPAIMFFTIFAQQEIIKKDVTVISNNGLWRIENAGNAIRMWCILHPQSVKIINNYRQDIYKISLSPDDRYIALSSENNIVHIWDNDTQQFIQQHINNGYYDPVYNIHAQKPSSKIAYAVHNRIKDLQGKLFVQQIRTCQWSADSKRLITVAPDQLCKTWDRDSW